MVKGAYVLSRFHGDKIIELTMKSYLSNLSASKLSVHVDG